MPRAWASTSRSRSRFLCGALFLVVALALRMRYASTQSADVATADQAARYLLWFIPAMALQFPFVAMSAALRGDRQLQARRRGRRDDRGDQHGGGARADLRVARARRRWASAARPLASFVAIVVGAGWLSLHFRRDPILTFARAELSPEDGGVEARARDRPSRRLRLRDDGRVPVHRLRRDAPLRRRGAGGVRHRDARPPGRLHARRRAGDLGGADRRPELRRAIGRSRAGTPTATPCCSRWR